jgi:hypothetical protein
MKLKHRRPAKERDEAEAEVRQLRKLVKGFADFLDLHDPRHASARYDMIAEGFYKETGLFAPGKSIPPAMGLVYTPEEEIVRGQKWRDYCDRWHETRFDDARAAIAALAPEEE